MGLYLLRPMIYTSQLGGKKTLKKKASRSRQKKTEKKRQQ